MLISFVLKFLKTLVAVEVASFVNYEKLEKGFKASFIRRKGIEGDLKAMRLNEVLKLPEKDVNFRLNLATGNSLSPW